MISLRCKVGKEITMETLCPSGYGEYGEDFLKREEKKLEGLEMLYEDLTQKIIGAAIEVHKQLGPGLLESVYQACLARELDLSGIHFEQQKDLPVEYKGVRLESGLRLDFIVENKVVIEIKSIEALHPIHEAQLLTYLKITGCKVGLLINFNVAVLTKGIVRKVL
ncbi:GxxExxY protein [Longilinea arvoryzae]|nr:GxxExxY protein [Longilinea arvoryzae]